MPAKAQWRDSIRPRIDDARVQLRDASVDTLSASSGGLPVPDGLTIALFGSRFHIAVPTFEITQADGSNPPEETQMLLLDYLIRAKSESSSSRSPRKVRWIGFQELPNGAFYAKAFRSYSSDYLVRALDGEVSRFCRASQRFGGEPLALADASFSFLALPKIELAVVWWTCDEEFPASASVLFDSAVAGRLPIDGMAALGRILCHGLVAAFEDNSGQHDESMSAGSRAP